MWQLVTDGFNYLMAQSASSLFGLFWFVILFEIPRYTLGFLSVAALGTRTTHMAPDDVDVGRVSVVIAGHNEEDAIERCVLSLHEQSRQADEIIVVSDGSTDRTPEKVHDLQRRGLIQEAHCLQVRGGKSAA